MVLFFKLNGYHHTLTVNRNLNNQSDKSKINLIDLFQNLHDMFLQLPRKPREIRTRRVCREGDTKTLFRFEPENVEWLVRTFLGNAPDETRGAATTKLEQMKSCLRYLASPDFQVGVGEDLGIDQSVVSRKNFEVLEKIVAEKDMWIRFPDTEAEANVARDNWAQKYEFPGAIAAIDCVHVKVLKPGGQFGDEYINRNNYASHNVQATCDAYNRFTSVDASWPGSSHDSLIFTASGLREILIRFPGKCVIGDKGYPCTTFCQSPYRAYPLPQHKCTIMNFWQEKG